MAYTQIDLITAILEEMGVRDPGQDISPEDQDIIVRRLPGKVAELNTRNVCYIADTNDIEEVLFLPFAKIMAAECATAFGIIGERYAQLQAYGGPDGPAEFALKDAVRLRNTDQTLRIDRFWRTTYGRAR